MPESVATCTQGPSRPQASESEAPRALGRSDRPDAISTGIVRGAAERAADSLAGKEPAPEAGRAGEGKRSPIAAGEAARGSGRAAQAKLNLKRSIEDAAVAELDDTDEFSGVGQAHSSMRSARSIVARRQASKGAAGAAGPKRKADLGRKAGEAVSQGKRGLLAGRAAMQASGAAAGKRRAARAARAATSAGSKGAVAASASAVAAPVAGVVAGIVAFLIAALAVSQVLSALFGFWQNEASARTLDGLPPYITYEMVEEALACQEEYGHPAGCTIAQVIVESGQGDHLSGLATQDHNLFGMKWSSAYALCEEVLGKSSWRTGEEYDGEAVTISADFISFKGDAECIRFRSRVFLQADRYAGNALIQEAIAERDSGKMAEGLKDAGWATSSSYAESLKSAMEAYDLYRFDGMSPEDLQNGAFSSDAIVSAAYSQLGVPYVWGGTTANVGLDCSGLAQYCYRQAGISIPRNTEAQYAQATKVALSEAQPGDILYRTGHVGIYIGGDKYIHAPHSGDVVKVSSGISSFICALRYR